MKIKSTTSHSGRKKLFIIGAIVLLLAAGAATYFLLIQNKNNSSENTSGMRDVNTVDYGPPKSTDKIGESDKDKTADQDNSTNPPSKPAKLGVTITNSSQDETAVYIRAITSDAATGQCKATLTRGSSVIIKEAALSAQADYGICQGFNIPKTELNQTGDWKIKVEISGNNLQGEAETTLGVTQ